ncbi:hypothetical protein GLOIN_2v1776801 [Rhizophagus irregularis DAOM 181602=DAOM 197198]|nr:hypothetical protein GLOIN_2v1776801 [Rhizophagus irregularis DAOM 181602=DAOM 197198]
MQLAACTDCHKLHNVKDIIAYKEEGKVAIMNCPYKEYPNNPISSRTQRNENNIYSDIYDGKHSTGAIYASICNLLRSERNKPENIIYLGFLPGPKEAGLEIKVALIVGLSDTPATRKLFGHGSVVMKCYRCDKRITYSEEFRKTHYGGMQDYNEWSSREAHFKVHGIRWTEVLRLLYMDPIQFAVVDPMHCLFLAQNRMDNIDLPSDIGRIPPKIAIGNDGAFYVRELFPFERLNGYIESYPNSNRQIEPELMKIVLKNTLVDYHLSCKWTSGLLDESLHLLVPKKAVGSLAITAEREELQHFLFMRHNTSMISKIYGTEPLPGQMLNPSYINVIIPLELRGFLCEWYAILYEREKEDVLGFMDLHMNQHARLQIGAEIFGSMISGRHEKNANIFAKWKAANDDSVETYPGEVQYYFEHALRFPEGTKTHLLARAPNGANINC